LKFEDYKFKLQNLIVIMVLRITKTTCKEVALEVSCFCPYSLSLAYLWALAAKKLLWQPEETCSVVPMWRPMFQM
jgi:hypothetical protein